MPDFTNSAGMIDAIRAKVVGSLASLSSAYEEAGELIAKNARDRLGEYQDAEGVFPAWQPLTKETQDQRERLGYTRDDPLLRSGTLQQNIEVTASPEAAIVGVPNREVETPEGKTVNIGDIAEYLEKGTPSIPPRPFLGPALQHEREAAIIIVNRAIGERLRE